ncbi:helix-turn-helix domain-containing protein [Mesorhizobium sp.]|uniref:helix-turn-helix domain-containing protein n=1 Tax=Mesorhizobium sp. TaxID=1871066 RepID=UPI0025D4F9C3|nr:helix-turn-helix domain-containing protein [Mesorhizobium sp.]
MLELLAGERDSLESSNLADRLDMPASAVHRLLATLVKHGWVIQDDASQKYALSLRISTLAFQNLDARNVPDVWKVATWSGSPGRKVLSPAYGMIPIWGTK